MITIDRRLIPEENLAEAERELMDTLSSVRGTQWEVSNIHRNATVPPLHDPITGQLADILKDVTGQTGQYGEMDQGTSAHRRPGVGSQALRPGNHSRRLWHPR